MRPYLVDLFRCPECRRFPLELQVVEERPSPHEPPVPDRLCTGVCGLHGHELGERCGRCVTTEVEAGYLYCAGCGRFYFVVDGIARLLGEDFADLLDPGLASARPDAFRGRERELEAFLARLGGGGRSATATWNLEDVSFWEQEVYADAERVRRERERVDRSRPDAGNRTYPRERDLFRTIRPRLRGGTLVDVGCGFSQTIRILCDPAREGYDYVGTDLSLSALRAGRDALAGDFVQCSGERLPFRPGTVDAIVMLGTLHHLADHEAALAELLATLRPGGLLGLHEVTARRRRAAVESAHNEAVDLEVVLPAISREADLLRLKREYSPLRALLVGRLAEPMRGSPALTRLVLAADDAFLATVGRLPALGSRAALLLAEKRG